MPSIPGQVPFPQEAKPSEETAGAVTASSISTTLTAPATANTKASTWTQLIASTTKRAIAIAVELAFNGAFDLLVDVGTGASGSEVVLLSDLMFGGTTGSNMAYNFSYLFFIAIPVGTRISGRCQSNPGSGSVRVSCYLVEEE